MKNYLDTSLNILLISSILVVVYSLFQISFKYLNKKYLIQDLETIVSQPIRDHYQANIREIKIFDSLSNKEVIKTIMQHENYESQAFKSLWDDFQIEVVHPQRIFEGDLVNIILKISNLDKKNKQMFDMSAGIRYVDHLFYEVDSLITERKSGYENSWVWSTVFKKDTGLEIEIYDHKTDLTWKTNFSVKIYRTSQLKFLKFMQENAWLSWFLGSIGTCMYFAVKFFKGNQKKPYT